MSCIFYILILYLDKDLNQSSEEVRMSGSEASHFCERKEIWKLVDSNFVEFKESSNTDRIWNSVARLNNISKNWVEISVYDSWDANDWEESKPQCFNSSNIKYLLTDQKNSFKDFQYETKLDWKLNKIISDFKSKIDDPFDTVNSTGIDESNIG